MPFHKELKRLGLKDKEAAVYLACLELGPSPVQVISRKAKVVRATTYVVLDSLAQRGLVTQYKEGKKTLFSAEPPRQLMRLLEKREEEISERKHDLEQLIPGLQVLMKSGSSHAVVRYFEGTEGLQAIRREMLMYSDKGDSWYNFTPSDFVDALLDPKDEKSFYRQRIAKGIRGKTIFTTKSKKQKGQLLEERGVQDTLTQRRFVPSNMFPSTSGLTVFKDRVAIGSFTGQVGGIIIESETMADMMRHMFELAWIAAKDLD